MSILSELPRLLRASIRRHLVPGACIAIYRNGRVTEAAAGVLNLDTGVPVTTSSLFQIGSITKIFTTTLILQLQDEGLLDIDAPLRRYLPGFRVADDQASRTVTLRQLLCHSSGIEGDFFVDSGRGDDCISRLQDMGRLLPQVFPPGERMSYCNFGFAMLGRVIETLTGTSFDAAIRKRLFEPLDMTHAFTRPEDAIRFRTAVGHTPDPKRPDASRVTLMPWLPQGMKAAGSTPSMSVGDLMRFVHVHLNSGKSKAGRRILSAASVRSMMQRQIRLPKNAPRGMNAWGLGWTLGTWSGKRVVGHDGSTIGQNAFLRVLAEKKLAVGLLTNGGDALALFDDLFSRTFEQLGRVKPSQAPQPEKPVKIDPARVTGRFENLTGSLEISSDGDDYTLNVEPRPGMLAGLQITRTPLEFLDRNTARIASNDEQLNRTTLTFEGTDPGRPTFVGMASRLYRRV